MNSAKKTKVLAVIPARYASTRFPGKIIAPLAGKPLVVYAYERACQCALIDEALVATDNECVVRALEPLGVPTLLTRNDHPSGTDRIAEVVSSREDADIIVNVQGDEPLIDPATIAEAIRPLLDDATVAMSTAKRQITELAQIANSNVVKVVCDENGRALYFSRAAIPAIRDKAGRDDQPDCYWEHVGLYVYRREFLLEYAGWKQTPLEKLEKLEQLRALERGYPIAVVETKYESIGVDTLEDLERVKALITGETERDDA